MAKLIQRIPNYHKNEEYIITLYNKLEEIITTKNGNNGDEDDNIQIRSKRKQGRSFLSFLIETTNRKNQNITDEKTSFVYKKMQYIINLPHKIEHLFLPIGYGSD